MLKSLLKAIGLVITSVLVGFLGIFAVTLISNAADGTQVLAGVCLLVFLFCLVIYWISSLVLMR